MSHTVLICILFAGVSIVTHFFIAYLYFDKGFDAGYKMAKELFAKDDETKSLP